MKIPMQVLPSTLRHAAIRVFKAVSRDVAAVEEREFRKEWEATGLRQSDCRPAINEMLRCNFFKIATQSSRKYIVLTDAGYDECQRLSTPLSRQFLDWVTLERAQWRRTRLSAPEMRQRRRRIGDGAAAPKLKRGD